MSDFPKAPNSLATVLANVSQVSDRISDATERLSSGLRIRTPQDDPGGSALATRLATDAVVMGRGSENAYEALLAYEEASDAADELYSIVQKIQVLADAAQNPVTSNREELDEEAQALIGEYERVVGIASYNQRQLIDGSVSGLQVQAGMSRLTLTTDDLAQDFEAYVTTSLVASVYANIDLTTQGSAELSYLVSEVVLEEVGAQASTVYASKRRLESVVSLLAETRELTADASGRITDVNVADELAQRAKDAIIQDSGLAMVAQSTLSTLRVLTLLDGDLDSDTIEQRLTRNGSKIFAV